MTRAVIVCPHCGHRILPNAAITPRQKKVLAAIVDYHGSKGYPPTYDEIVRAVQVSRNIVEREVGNLLRRELLIRPFRGPRNLFPTTRADTLQ